MAKTSVLQYCILDCHVEHFLFKSPLLTQNLKGNKASQSDIGQKLLAVFSFEKQQSLSSSLLAL